MKTPKTSRDDDFSFDTGDSFEFFPLDGSADNEKPPKGIKGYFKNVVKSVGRLGVKVTGDLFPDVVDFKNQFFDGADSSEKGSLKSKIKNANTEIKKYGNAAKDVSKEIRKDIKHAVTTGEFARNDDDFDMGAFFGDDGNSFDFGGDDFSSNESETPDSSGTKKSKISTQEITAKSAVATAKFNSKLAERQVAAVMGATQTHIAQEKLMFAMQNSISQEQHVQKMAVMKNIAVNISKIIKQNNMSNRAQMEFSAKQLAFSQDLHALVKEIRNAQWAISRPDPKKELNKSNYDKIINGGGFNLKYLKNQFKEQFLNNSALSGITDIKSQIDTLMEMSDMMGGPGKAIKEMVGDSLRVSLINRMLSGNTKNKINLTNQMARGLPGAINRWFGKMSETGGVTKGYDKIKDKLPKFVRNFVDKNGITQSIEDKLGFMQMRDHTKTVSDRFAMGDPDKVHPFDNKAHKVLTEVIPAYLSRIDAGINHTEQTYYDFKSNGFKKKSVIENDTKKRVESATEYMGGVYEFNTSLNDAFNGSNVGLKTFKDSFDDKAIKKIVNNALASKTGIGDLRNRLADPNMRDSALKTLLSGTGIDLTTLNENPGEKSTIINQLISAIRNLENSGGGGFDNAFIAFQNSQDLYASAKTEAYMESESYANQNTAGGSTFYSQMAGPQEYKKRIQENKLQIKRIEDLKRKLKELKGGKDKPNGKTITDKAINERLSKLDNDQKRLLAENQSYQNALKGEASGVNDYLSNFNYSNFEKMDGLDDYAIKDINDDSTHGLVKNIYNLLLEGITVFPETANGKNNKHLAIRRSTAQSQFKAAKLQQNESKISDQGMDEIDISNYKDETSFIHYALNNGLKVFTYDKENGEFNDITNDVKKSPESYKETTLYCKSNVYNAMYNKFNKVEDFNRNKNFKSFGESIDENKGFLGKLKKGVNFFNTGVGGIAGLANKWVGKHLYDMEGEQELDDQEQTVSNKYNSYKSTFDPVVKNIKEYAKNIKEKGFIEATKQSYKEVKQLLKKAKNETKQKIQEKLDSVKDSELAENLNKAKGLKEKLAILKEYSKAKASEVSSKAKSEAEKLYKEAEKLLKEDYDTIKEIDKEKNGGENSSTFTNIENGFKSTITKTKEVKKQITDALTSVKNSEVVEKLKNANSIQECMTILSDHAAAKVEGSEKAQAALDKLNKLKLEHPTAFENLNKASKFVNETKQKILKSAVVTSVTNSKAFKTGTAALATGAGFMVNKLNDFIFRKNQTEESNKIEGDSAEEQKEIKEKEEAKKREEENLEIQKKRNGLLSRFAKFFDKAEKHGIEINDESAEKIGEATGENVAENMPVGTSGTADGATQITDKIADKMDSMGLGKYSKFVRMGGRALGFASKFIGKGKGGKAGALAAAAGTGVAALAGGNAGGQALEMVGDAVGTAKTVKDIASAGGAFKTGKKIIDNVLKGGAKQAANPGGVKGILKGLFTPAKTIGKGAVKGGGIIGRAIGLVKKLLELLFTKGPVAKLIGKAAQSGIVKGITGGIKTAAKKLMSKLTSFITSYGSVIGIAIPITTAVAGIIKGMANAKRYFKLGAGVKPPFTMQAACGLAEGIDGLLLGIPGIIAKVAGKESLPAWFYDLIASPESKAALTRYMQYNTKRAKIYGISSPTKLTDYENRNGLEKAGRAILSAITFGIADSNDEKDAKILGFKSVTIYKYWVDNKFKPLNELYDQLANATDDKGQLIYGGKEVVEDFNNDSATYDDDGRVIEDDEDNKKLLDKIDKQNAFRKIFLQQAINKVKELGNAWLTSECTCELFEKMTGKPCKEMQTKGEKAKALAKKAAPIALKALGWTFATIPMAAVTAGKFLGKTKIGKAVAKKVKGGINEVKNRFGAALKGKNIRDAMYKLMHYSDNTKNVMEQGAGVIQSAYKDFLPPEDAPGAQGAAQDAANNAIASPETGGAEPTGENFTIQQIQERINNSVSKMKERASPFSLKAEDVVKRTKELAKRSINGSPVMAAGGALEKLTNKYNEEISKKLDMLQKINEEQVRHNDVTEKFFTSCLAMIGELARSKGNDNVASQVDNMVRMVTR